MKNVNDEKLVIFNIASDGKNEPLPHLMARARKDIGSVFAGTRKGLVVVHHQGLDMTVGFPERYFRAFKNDKILAQMFTSAQEAAKETGGKEYTMPWLMSVDEYERHVEDEKRREKNRRRACALS